MSVKLSSLIGLLSGMLWGLGLTISSYILLNYNISPFLLALLHDFFSIFILLFIIYIKEKKLNLKILLNIKSLPIVLAAILAGPIGMQANLYAIKYIGGSLTSLITAIYPLIAVILSLIFLKNKISKRTIVGVILVTVGLFIQNFKYDNIENFYIGIIFALCCALAWGSESVLSSYTMSNSLNEIEALVVRQITSFLFYIFWSLFKINVFEYKFNISIWILIFIMVFINMLSYLLYYMTINKIGPAKATGLNVSYVLWTVVFSYLFLNLEITIQMLLTSIVIIIGVYIIVKE